MTEEQGYNGWKNYETWSVALIIDNDQGTQAEALELVRDAVENGRRSEYWSEEERRRYVVADALKDWIEESTPDLDEASHGPLAYLWSQLISAALSEVDWNEIAEHYLADLEQVR